MPTVASLNVAITATGGGLEAGLASAGANIQKFSWEADRAVKNLSGRLEEQIATYGQNADAVEVWRLKSKGATDEQIKAVAELQAKLKALRDETAAKAAADKAAADAKIAADKEVAAAAKAAAEQQAAAERMVAAQRAESARVAAAAEAERMAKINATNKAVADVESGLRRQIATYQMSAEEITRWDLVQAGASQEQINRVVRLQAEYARLSVVPPRGGLGGLADSLQAGADKFYAMKQQAEKLMPAIALAFGTVKLVESFSQSMSEASNELLRGEKSAKEFGLAILSAIPGVDEAAGFMQKMVDANRDTYAALLQLIVGENEYSQALRSRASVQAEIDKANEKTRKFLDANQGSQDRIKALDDEIALLKARNDQERELIRIEQERRDALAKLEKNSGLVTDSRKATEQQRIDEKAALEREKIDKERAKKEAEDLGKSVVADAESYIRWFDRIAEKSRKAKEEADKAAEEQKKIDEAEAKYAQDQADRLTASMRTKREIYQDELDRIKDLQDKGLIDQKTADRAKEAAAKDAGLNQPETLAGIAQRGSAEAFAASRRTIDQSQKVQDEQLKTQKELLAETRKQNGAKAAQPPQELP